MKRRIAELLCSVMLASAVIPGLGVMAAEPEHLIINQVYGNGGKDEYRPRSLADGVWTFVDENTESGEGSVSGGDVSEGDVSGNQPGNVCFPQGR